MSRYDLSVKPGTGAARAVIGWDRPLQTFFVQVSAPKVGGEEAYLLWLGTEPFELPSADRAVQALAAYSEVPPDVVEKLKADKAASADVQDGPCQAEMLRVLGLLPQRSNAGKPKGFR